jgi:uncharacterized protein (TIGR02598 family)
MRNRFRNGDGFTLVEVMLALAIVSIGLIAILGLLPTGLRSARDAADNTISATIVQDVFNTIRTNQFISVNLSDFGTVQAGQPTPPYNLQNNYAPITFYFDQEGFRPATPQDHYFQVTLTFTNQAPALPALSMVTATVVWPAQSKNPANHNVFVTRIAQYNQ